MVRPSVCRAPVAHDPATVPRRLRLPGLAAAAIALAGLALSGCAGTVARSPARPQGVPPQTEAVSPPQTITPAAPPGTATPHGPQIKVALLVPLSGSNARLGRAILEAAEMAVFDAADDTFVLMPRDTQGTAEGAAQAATAALGEGAELILGPLLAAEVEAVKPVAQRARINVVAFSTAEQLADGGTFLLGFLARQNVERITAFAHERGATRFAALAPSTPYGELVVSALREATGAVGATLDQVEYYEPGSRDLRPVVRRLTNVEARQAALARQRQQLEAQHDEASQLALKRLEGRTTTGDTGFDAILIPDGGAKLKAVASLLPYYDVDTASVHVLGTGLWDEAGLGSEPALVGGWFAAPAPEARGDFEKRFADFYKHPPPRLATLGYDAAALAAVLAQRAPAAPFTAAALTDPSGFVGVDGIFRFHPDGRVERGLAVLEVERTGVKVVSPAPDTFEKPAS